VATALSRSFSEISLPSNSCEERRAWRAASSACTCRRDRLPSEAMTLAADCAAAASNSAGSIFAIRSPFLTTVL
jgi:hypothetical protein